MHTVSPQHPPTPNPGSKIMFLMHDWLNLWVQNPKLWRANCIFIKKNSHISGPAQFTHVLQGSHVLTFCSVSELSAVLLPKYWLTGNLGTKIVIIMCKIRYTSGMSTLEPVLPSVPAKRLCNPASSDHRRLNCRSTCLRVTGQPLTNDGAQQKARSVSQILALWK